MDHADRESYPETLPWSGAEVLGHRLTVAQLRTRLLLMNGQFPQWPAQEAIPVQAIPIMLGQYVTFVLAGTVCGWPVPKAHPGRFTVLTTPSLRPRSPVRKRAAPAVDAGSMACSTPSPSSDRERCVPAPGPGADTGFNGGRSSVGRALDCDSSRRGFESHRPPQFLTGFLSPCWAVSSIGRAADSYSVGSGFESLTAHQFRSAWAGRRQQTLPRRHAGGNARDKTGRVTKDWLTGDVRRPFSFLGAWLPDGLHRYGFRELAVRLERDRRKWRNW